MPRIPSPFPRLEWLSGKRQRPPPFLPAFSHCLLPRPACPLLSPLALLSTLPVALRGRAAMNVIRRGTCSRRVSRMDELQQGLLLEARSSVGATNATGCSPRRVRQTDDGRLLHAGDIDRAPLRSSRINIDAVDDEHVLLAIGDEEAAVPSRWPTSPVEPAIAQGPRGGFRLIPQYRASRCRRAHKSRR
jgi:hypothetical protein